MDQPNQRDLAPNYAQTTIVQTDVLTPLVTPTGADQSLSIQADVSIHRLHLPAQQSLVLSRESSRMTYLHIVEGSVLLDNEVFNEGDGIGVHQAQSIRLIAQDELVALWFDLPADN